LIPVVVGVVALAGYSVTCIVRSVVGGGVDSLIKKSI
jgi:hypothetical protein